MFLSASEKFLVVFINFGERYEHIEKAEITIKKSLFRENKAHILI